MSFGIPVRNGVMLGLTASTALSTRGGFPVPALSLDFLSGTLDSRITFTRALNTATRVNSSGFIETVNADIPRFDYDPVTLQPRGLLIEEARTNVRPASNDFTNATYWTQNGSPTILADQEISPDGTQNADTFEVSGSSNGFGVYSAATIAAGTYACSLYFKRLTGNIVVRLGFSGNSSTVNITTLAVTNGTNSVGAVTPWKDGYYRFVVVTTIAAPTQLNIYSIGSNTGKMAIYGCQVEAGAFATSYIPTTTTSLTRNADVATMTGTNFSSWYNQSEGTFVINIQKLSPSSVATYAYEVTGATSSFSMRVRLGTDARMQSVDGGAVQVDAQLASSTQTTPSKYAMAYRLNDYAGSANGAAAVLDASATVPAISSLSLGSVAVTNMYLRTFTYFSRRLPNDRLPALTR